MQLASCEASMNQRIRIERLPNGFIRIYDYACQWDGLYNEDGSYRSGAAQRWSYAVKQWLTDQASAPAPIKPRSQARGRAEQSRFRAMLPA